MKDLKERFIYYDIDKTMQIFREIPFFRPQNIEHNNNNKKRSSFILSIIFHCF